MDTSDEGRRLWDVLNRAAYDELQLRVGTRLSEGMSDLQLEEFEALIDRNRELLSAWLRNNSPDFENDPQFKAMEKMMPEADLFDLVAEYAATKWLELNAPNYRSIVAGALEELRGQAKMWADSGVLLSPEENTALPSG